MFQSETDLQVLPYRSLKTR